MFVILVYTSNRGANNSSIKYQLFFGNHNVREHWHRTETVVTTTAPAAAAGGPPSTAGSPRKFYLVPLLNTQPIRVYFGINIKLGGGERGQKEGARARAAAAGMKTIARREARAREERHKHLRAQHNPTTRRAHP